MQLDFINYFITIRNILITQAKDTVEKLGLTPTQVFILMTISENPNISSSGIQKAINLDKAIVSRALSSLHKKKLITKKNSPLDKKLYSISLTVKGKNISSLIQKHKNNANSKIVKSLTKKEIIELEKTLQNLVRKLNN